MLRILICSPKEETARQLQQSAYRILQTVRIRCELACSISPAGLVKNFNSKAKPHDILFLDHQDADCLQYAQLVRDASTSASIVFFGKPPVDINRLLAYRPSYLLTGSEPQALREALIRCRNEQLRPLSYFPVKTRDVQMRIDHRSISCFESRQRIVLLHTEQQTLEFYGKLNDVFATLADDRFIRCHQSYIVNMEKVRLLDKANRLFVMQSGRTIEISKSHYKDVVEAFQAFSRI